jgi:hypothetical protein
MATRKNTTPNSTPETTPETETATTADSASAVTSESTSPTTPETTDEAERGTTPDSTSEDEPGTTTLDSDVTKPSVTAPGDGPADTTDPTEIAVSVSPSPGDEAIAVGTVNAVVPVTRVEAAVVDESEQRFETYPATKPDGTVVEIRRNVDTGASSVITSK